MFHQKILTILYLGPASIGGGWWAVDMLNCVVYVRCARRQGKGAASRRCHLSSIKQVFSAGSLSFSTLLYLISHFRLSVSVSD